MSCCVSSSLAASELPAHRAAGFCARAHELARVATESRRCRSPRHLGGNLGARPRWLLAHLRFVLHFTPTSRSWLNLVERRFSELTTTKLGRGAHRSTRALTQDIEAWIEAWNDDPEPSV